MRVIFINRFFWPDELATAQLLADLAELLAARGHEIVVIASHPGAPGVSRTETRRGVRIERVRSSRRRNTGLAGKAAGFATFLAGALWRLLFAVRRGDVVVAMTDPPLLGVGAWFVARLRGARLVHWVQDIYPELAIELAGQRWLRALVPLRNLTWRRADACVTLGADMAATVASAGVAPGKISIIPNWAPAGLALRPLDATNALRREWGLEGRFVVAYCGNLGRVHDLNAILAVADAMRTDSAIAFIIVGDGAQLAFLKAEVSRLELGNIAFHPPQPRTRLAELLALADVHLVTLRPGCERYVFPSKLYGIAAIGRPVLFIGPRDCALARLVVERGFGRIFAPEDTVAMAATIRALSGTPADCALLGAAAVRFAVASGDASLAANGWLAVLTAMKTC